MDISGHKNLLSLQQYLDSDRRVSFKKYRELFVKEGVWFPSANKTCRGEDLFMS